MKLNNTLNNTEDCFKKIIEQEKAAKAFGFYWENADQLIDQMISETKEIQEAIHKGDRQHIKEEIGDLMNVAVSLCIFLNIDPLGTLKYNIEKFQKRYDKLVAYVAADGLPNLKNKPMSMLMEYWNKAKL